jgi:hypothetical protein
MSTLARAVAGGMLILSASVLLAGAVIADAHAEFFSRASVHPGLPAYVASALLGFIGGVLLMAALLPRREPPSPPLGSPKEAREAWFSRER